MERQPEGACAGLGVWCTCFLTIGTGKAETRNAAQVVTAGVLFL